MGTDESIPEGFFYENSTSVPWWEAVGSKELVKILVTAPRSGLRTSIGDDIARGCELALLDLKASASSFMWSLSQSDDMDNRDAGLEIAERAINDPDIVGVVGSPSDQVAMSQTPVFGGAGLPFFPLAADPRLTERGFKNVFRLQASEEKQLSAAADLAARVLNKRRAAVIYYKTSEPLVARFEDAVQRDGLKVVGRAGLSAGETGLDKRMAQLKDLDPDVILLLIDYIDGVEAIRSIWRAGFPKGIAVIGNSMMYSSRVPKRGRQAVDGLFAVVSGGNLYQRQPASRMRAMYMEQYGEEPEDYALFAYDATRILMNAVEAAKSRDRSATVRAIRDVDLYHGLSGQIHFDEQGQNTKVGMGVFRIEEEGWKYFGSVPVFDPKAS